VSFRFSPCIGGGELGAPPGDASGLLACDSCGTASDFGGSLNDDFPGEKSSLSLLAGEGQRFQVPRTRQVKAAAREREVCCSPSVLRRRLILPACWGALARMRVASMAAEFVGRVKYRPVSTVRTRVGRLRSSPTAVSSLGLQESLVDIRDRPRWHGLYGEAAARRADKVVSVRLYGPAAVGGRDGRRGEPMHRNTTRWGIR
jgi:hypothetical protein